jgi:RHS repeat-associated protein
LRFHARFHLVSGPSGFDVDKDSWSYGSTAASYNVNQLIGVKQWTASNTACSSTATPVYSESYLYNSKALVSSKTISTGGVNYTTSSTYDSYGRPYELTYPTVGSITGPKIRTEYSNGAAYKTTDYSSGSAGTVYHLTTAVNARGQSTGVTYGNGVTATFSYGDDTGWLQSNAVKKGTTTIQNYSYAFDDVGNVISRDISFVVGSSANLKETFLYDDLHRVTSRTVNTKLNLTGTLAMTESYGYDGNGNLIKKTNVGYYQYNVTGKPNRLAAVWQNNDFTGTKYYGFTYDANGNVTNDGKRSFTYTPFDKPSLVTQGTDTTSFSYGPNRELIKRIDARSTGTTTTLMLDGYEQITLPSGVVEHKYNVGDAVITKRSNGANETYYLHKDQQGSTTAITNAAGTTVQQFLYDPWGKQYLVNNSLLTYTSPATSKGYTGHEMVNDFEVIHMGGRTYNPVLGRFMQADPFIQAPDNLQSYNRYSYVLNNPMSYTDPSGYFFKKLGNLIKDNWRIIAAAVVSYYTFGAVSGMLLNSGGLCAANLTLGQAMLAGAASGFVGGAIVSGNLRGATKGALTGAITGGVSQHLSASGTSFKDASYRIAVSAAGGCAAGEVSGGNCSDGARKPALAQAVLVSMEAYSGYKHSLKAAEGDPVVKAYGEGVHDPKVPNVGESIEIARNSANKHLIGTKLKSLSVADVTALLEEKVGDRYINVGKLWVEDGVAQFGFGTEQDFWMRAVAKVPGMNSMAVFHDKWMANISASSSLVLVPTIAPALYGNYMALGTSSYKYYARNIRDE